MRSKILHIIFFLGILIIFLAALWWGRNQLLFLIFSNFGAFVSLVSLIILVYESPNWKRKIKYLFVTVTSIALYYLFAPTLQKTSYLIYLSSHINELDKLNETLLKIDGAVHITSFDIKTDSIVVSDSTQVKIQNLREDTDAYLVIKNRNYIYYRLYGFINHGGGVVYKTGNYNNNNLRHIKDNWYFDR